MKKILRKITVTMGAVSIIGMASVLIVAVHVTKFFRRSFIRKEYRSIIKKS